MAEIGDALEAPQGAELVDGEGLHAFPAFVDPHVHLRTPGREDEEDLDSGTRAAAAGGFCAILAQPNTDPVVDSAPVLRSLRERARAEARIPTGFLAAITVGQAGRAADRDGRAGRRRRGRLHRRRPAGAVGRRDAPGAPVPAPRGAAAGAARGGPLAVGPGRDARGRGVGAARPGRHPVDLGVDHGGARLRASRPTRRAASTSSTCPRAETVETIERARRRRRAGDRRGHAAPPAAHRRGGPRRSTRTSR